MLASLEAFLTLWRRDRLPPPAPEPAAEPALAAAPLEAPAAPGEAGPVALHDLEWHTPPGYYKALGTQSGRWRGI